jgi:hypothetical protein
LPKINLYYFGFKFIVFDHESREREKLFSVKESIQNAVLKVGRKNVLKSDRNVLVKCFI